MRCGAPTRYSGRRCIYVLEGCHKERYPTYHASSRLLRVDGDERRENMEVSWAWHCTIECTNRICMAHWLI